MDLAEIAATRAELQKAIGLAKTVHADARRLWIDRARTNLDRLKVIATASQGLDVGDLTGAAKEIEAAEEGVGALKAFLALPLAGQCDAISVPLEELILERTPDGWVIGGVAYAKPEPAAFAHYRLQGWHGFACEGAGPLMLMKCAALNFLASVNTFQSREDAAIRYLEAQCTIHADKKDQIIAAISAADEETVRRHFREVSSHGQFRSLYPAMDEDGLGAVFRALGSDGLGQLLRHLMTDPYAYRAGWPDLTLARGGELRFIEVKTSDKLHNSQRTTITNVLQPLGHSVSVLKLRKAK